MPERVQLYLKAVEVPEHCFLSEAVEWIALGRVPEAEITLADKTYEPVDYRFYWREMPDNFEPSDHYPWFDRYEFESLGLPVNEEYFRAAEVCLMEGVMDLPNQIRRYEEMKPTWVEQESGEFLNFTAQLIGEAEEKLKKFGNEKQIVEEAEEGFNRFLELGWAQLFQWIQRRRITIEGIDLERWERLADSNKYEEAARFDAIPETLIELSLDWRANSLDSELSSFVALRTPVSSLVDLLEDAGQSWSSTSVERFGAFFRMRNAASNFKAQPLQGGPLGGSESPSVHFGSRGSMPLEQGKLHLRPYQFCRS